jgi:glycosyltransferase involved in cell wall biosynthesis
MRSSGPLVSVALLTYNHERFITKAIESVLAQRTDFPIEVVIGDDASSDGTSAHVAALKAQAPEVIRTLPRPSNIGMHQNVEGVLRECRGEFVAFLEGDDYWTSEEKLQLQVDVLHEHESAVGTFHPVIVVDALGEESDPFNWRDKRTAIGPEITTQELLEDNLIPTASAMIRRVAIPSLSDRYTKLNMRDWPIWVFSSLRGPWLYLPKVMAAYRVHDHGTWSSLSAAQQRDSVIKLVDAFVADLPPLFAAVARQRLARIYVEAFAEALARGRPAEAYQALHEVVRRLPHCRMRHGRRFVSEFVRVLSPRTHTVASQALRVIRARRPR